MLMVKGWDKDPAQRPEFEDVVDTLNTIIAQTEADSNMWGVAAKPAKSAPGQLQPQGVYEA